MTFFEIDHHYPLPFHAEQRTSTIRFNRKFVTYPAELIKGNEGEIVQKG
jgi:hypothetical protein